MGIVHYKYDQISKNDRIFIVALILSLLVHIIVLFLLNRFEMIKIDLSSEKEEMFEDLTIILPEEKPKMIVENINENNDAGHCV